MPSGCFSASVVPILATRADGVLYPGRPGGSRGRLHPARPDRAVLTYE